MELRSTAFARGETIPARFACDGDDISPPLDWTHPPVGAKSFVLLCDDPDAPGGTWHHWAVYDMPPDQTQISEGLPADARGVKQAINDFGRRGYGGPCPPRGHGPHRYRFTLLALDAPTLGLRDGALCRDVERTARRYVLGEAQLTGAYQR